MPTVTSFRAPKLSEVLSLVQQTGTDADETGVRTLGVNAQGDAAASNNEGDTLAVATTFKT